MKSLIKKIHFRILIISVVVGMICSMNILNSKISFADNNTTQVNSENTQTQPLKFDLFMKLLEGCYYIAGIAALLAIKSSSNQNKLLQQQINDNLIITNKTFKREISLITVKKCEEYAAKIIPLISQVTNVLFEKKIYNFDKKTFEKADFDDREEYDKFLKTNVYDKDAYANCINLANELEAYSMYFTEQICDSDIAFKATGQVLVDTMPYLYPYILQYRIKYRSNGYSNLIKLYLIWSSKFITEIIEDKNAELEKQEYKLQQKKEYLNKLKYSKEKDVEDLDPIGSGS